MNLLEQIQNYKPYNKQERKDKEIFLNYLTDFDNYLHRENEYGHLVSSALVLNKDRNKILMIHHNIYNAWAWLGGHADGDADLLRVAIKEVKEESGIGEVKPIVDDIFSLDTLPVLGHEKKGEYVPAHVHLSVAYLLEADENEELRVNEKETGGVKWIPLSEMVALSGEPQMEPVYEKAIKKMKELDFISIS
jgi:8-oxo-dGTP pyrophosphatase MutT (NUDIX family)